MLSVPDGLTREEFDARVTPHLDCLLRCARRVLGSEDLAHDAVQETLTRLWRRGWLPPDARRVLLGLVFRASLHERRRHRRRERHELAAARRGDEACAAGTCDDPHCTLEQHELAAALARALDALPPRVGAALRLRVHAGLEYEEIAQRLGIPLGTVRSRLHHARRLVARTLADFAPRSGEESVELAAGGRH
jgi:RNA polymerase sigma factor (sigma-70 family)